MGMPLLSTKLYIPPARPELVPRTRLIERMNAILRCKLALISAPAGFGKTTLLSEWGAHCGRPVAWVSLDEGDNDPTRFWTYLIAALRTVHPDVGEGALAALQSPQPPPIDLLLTGLINELTQVQIPIVLVLDDFHMITATQVNDGVVFLLDHLPRQMHVVISTRADPTWQLARRRARGEMTELRANDLRLTPEEVAAFLNDVMGLGLSAEDITDLDARTEGWIAGLQLAALAIRSPGSLHKTISPSTRKDATSFIKSFSSSHRFILDYLVEEVLDRQPPAIQRFLIETSILERMTAPLCDAVTSRKGGSQTILAELDRANLFLVPLDGERRWYRYHHLFTELLRGVLGQVEPNLAPILHRRASEWYAQQGSVDEAISHALASEDMARAADLIEQNAMGMIAHSELSTIAKWLDTLPDKMVRARPWLCIYHAWARYYLGPREQVEPRLRDAERALLITAQAVAPVTALTKSERQHIAGHVAALRAYMALQNEELERVSELARQALELLPEGDYARATAAIALAETPRDHGDLAASEQAYARARDIAEECGNLPMVVSAIAYMGLQQAKQGQLHQAQVTYGEALQLAVGSDGRQLPAAGLPYVKLGDLMREWNHLEAASHHLMVGIELCQRWGHADALVTGYSTLARVQLAQGELTTAQDTFRKVEQLARNTKVDPWAGCWMDDCRVQLWLATGDVPSAIRWVGKSGLRADDQLSFIRDLEHVTLARVIIAQGRLQPQGTHFGDALALLVRLLNKAESARWIGRTIEILALQALAHEGRGDTEEALGALAQALVLAEPEGYVRIFIDEGTPMGELLREAAGQPKMGVGWS